MLAGLLFGAGPDVVGHVGEGVEGGVDAGCRAGAHSGVCGDEVDVGLEVLRWPEVVERNCEEVGIHLAELGER